MHEYEYQSIRLLEHLPSAGTPQEQLKLVSHELHSARPLLTAIRAIYDKWLNAKHQLDQTAVREEVEAASTDFTTDQVTVRLIPPKPASVAKLQVHKPTCARQTKPPAVDWALVRKLLRQLSESKEVSLLEHTPLLSEVFQFLCQALSDAGRPEDGSCLLSVWKCSLRLLVRTVTHMTAFTQAEKERIHALRISCPSQSEIFEFQQLVKAASQSCTCLEGEISDLLELISNTDKQLLELQGDERRLLEQMEILRRKHSILAAESLVNDSVSEQPGEDETHKNPTEENLSPITPALVERASPKSTERGNFSRSRKDTKDLLQEVIQDFAELYSRYSSLVQKAEASIQKEPPMTRSRTVSTQTMPKFFTEQRQVKPSKMRVRRRSVSRRSVDVAAKAVSGAQFVNQVEKLLEDRNLECSRVPTWSIQAVEECISTVYRSVFVRPPDQGSRSSVSLNLIRSTQKLFHECCSEDSEANANFAQFFSSLRFHECKSVDANTFLQLCFSLRATEAQVLHKLLFALVKDGITTDDGRILFAFDSASHALSECFMNEDSTKLNEQMLALKIEVEAFTNARRSKFAGVLCGDLLLLVAKEVKSSVLLPNAYATLLSEIKGLLLQ